MRLYFICCHLSAKSEDFFGIWQVSILRVVFYSQIERALNLNNYCQMSVWRSFREIELYVAKCEKKAIAIWEKLRTFCMFSDKTKQKNSKFTASWQFLQTGFDKLMIESVAIIICNRPMKCPVTMERRRPQWGDIVKENCNQRKMFCFFVSSRAWDKEKNAEYLWGIESQTFGFRAPMHWNCNC